MQFINLYQKKKSLSMLVNACSETSNIMREFLEYFLNFTVMLTFYI